LPVYSTIRVTPTMMRPMADDVRLLDTGDGRRLGAATGAASIAWQPG
jgi:hypothetical protein